MRASRLLLGITLAAILVPAIASADILFIDANFSTSEIEIARKAAKKRGEEVVVVPAVSDEIRKKAAPLKAEFASAHSQSVAAYTRRDELVKKAAKMNPIDPKLIAQVEALDKRVKDIEAKEKAVEARLKQAFPQVVVSPAGLQAAINRQKSAGKTFTALVVSGHHGIEDNTYSGMFGSISIQDIAAAFSRDPEMRAGVKSAYLWGCYGGTVEKDRLWKRYFPELKVISGFEERAPLDGTAANLNHLSWMLEHEQKLTRKADELKKLSNSDQLSSVKRVFQGIESARPNSASVCIADVYSSHRKTQFLDDAHGCENEYPRILRKQQVFRSYFHAVDGYRKVPAENHSPLREYYTALRQYSHCERIVKEFGPDTQKVILLMLSADITKNFGLYYSRDIAAVNEWLVRSGRKPLADFSSLVNSRGDRLVEIGNLESACAATLAMHESARPSKLDRLRKLEAARTWDRQKDELMRYKRLASRMRTILGNLDCVPVSWCEPVPSVSMLKSPGKCVE